MAGKSEYTISAKVEATVEKSDLKKIQDAFDKIHISGVLSKDEYERLKKVYEEQQTNALKIKRINEDILKLKEIGTEAALKEIEGLKEFKAKSGLSAIENDEKLNAKNEEFKTKVKNAIGNAAAKAWSEISSTIKQFWHDLYQEALRMMDNIAAYSNNSILYSSEATNLKLNYGLSGKQAYAAQMASQETGFGSFDSFMENQFFATKEQREEWQKLYKKYEESYEQDEQVALEIQRFKREWEDMKKELSMEIVHFFMENKDVIKKALKAIIDVSKAIVSFFSWYVSLFGDPERSADERTAATNDIISSYAQNTNNSKVSISQTNNYSVDPNTIKGVNDSNNNEYLQLIRQLT